MRDRDARGPRVEALRLGGGSAPGGVIGTVDRCVSCGLPATVALPYESSDLGSAVFYGLCSGCSEVVTREPGAMEALASTLARNSPPRWKGSAIN